MKKMMLVLMSFVAFTLFHVGSAWSEIKLRLLTCLSVTGIITI
jgi:hypothetical protein